MQSPTPSASSMALGLASAANQPSAASATATTISDTSEAGPMMENNGTNGANNSGEKKVLVSELPLVFARQKPRSLESLSLEELQRFMLFVLQCERGPGKLYSLQSLDGPPPWWPPEVAFDDVILESQSKKGYWSNLIRRLIRSCYRHHSSEYLLDFSSRLMKHMEQIQDVRITHNANGTRTLISTKKDKPLVTYRAENQDYDKAQTRSMGTSLFNTTSPLKSGQVLSNQSNLSDPILPTFADVYLCDTCDQDFDSVASLSRHETQCKENFSSMTSTKFFSYLKLDPLHGTANNSANKVVKRPKPGSLAKFLSIDVTSPLGQYIFLRANPKAQASQGIQPGDIDVKSLCHAAAKREVSARQLIKAANEGDFVVTTTKAHRHLKHSHQYCFNKWQRRIRLFTIDSGLTPRSQKLLRECSKLTFAVMVERVELPTKLAPWSVYGDIPPSTILASDQRVINMARKKGFLANLQVPRLCIKPLPTHLVNVVMNRRSRYGSSSRSASSSRSNLSSRSASPITTPRPLYKMTANGDSSRDLKFKIVKPVIQSVQRQLQASREEPRKLDEEQSSAAVIDLCGSSEED